MTMTHVVTFLSLLVVLAFVIAYPPVLIGGAFAWYVWRD